MSAVVSIETAEAVFIVTDGAVYSEDNILTRVERKVMASSSGRVAVATRGSRDLGNYFSEKFILAVDRLGFDNAVSWMASQLHKFADRRPSMRIEATIAGMSEKNGPHRLIFRSDADVLDFEHPGLASSCATASAGLTEMGIRLRGQSEPWSQYLRAIAIPMMQFYREASVTCVAGEDFTAPAHLVGGQIDFTVVDDHGVSTETIHRWDDKIGQPITPFVEHKTVQPFPSMNRQQRRAAERDQRKRAG